MKHCSMSGSQDADDVASGCRVKERQTHLDGKSLMYFIYGPQSTRCDACGIATHRHKLCLGRITMLPEVVIEV